jgi:hypothetical protein
MTPQELIAKCKRLSAKLDAHDQERAHQPALQLSQYPRLSWLAWGSYQQPAAKGAAA